MHFALLDASLSTPHAARNFERDVDVPVTVFDVSGGEMPPPIGGPDAPTRHNGTPTPSFDGVIVSGSQSSVYDDRPWIQELSQWVEGAIADGLPILGVCWGHQLLAQVLGGSVKGGSYELGYVQIEQEAEDPIWEGIPSPFVAFATHSDHVVSLPRGSTLLAANDTGVQAFRYEQVYAVQFHPEYDRRTAEAMIRSKDVSEQTIEAALDTCTADQVEAAQTAKRIFTNFSEHAASVRPRASV